MPPKRHDPRAKRFDIGEYGSGSAPVEKDASLSWRDDPEETLSDWRIVVEVPALKIKNVYHDRRRSTQKRLLRATVP
jgi:hypothetical protein